MSKSILILLLCIIFIGCSKTTDPDDQVKPDPVFGDGTIYNSISWVGSNYVYDTTLAKNDFSLIYFHADWCSWCAKMEAETFTDADVKQIIGESFNIVMIDTESDSLVVHYDSTLTCQQFTQTYEISGIPQIVITYRDGSYIGKIRGYYDAVSFAQQLHNIRLNYSE